MRQLLPHFKRFLNRNPNPRFYSQPLSPPAVSDLRRSSSLQEINPLSRILSNACSSWRGGAHGGAPSGSLGFLASRFLSKRAAAGSKPLFFAGLVESGVQSLMVSLRRRPQRFDFGRLSNSGMNFRRYFNLSHLTPDGMVFGLIGVNVAVFLLWRIGDTRFMRQHFMISLDNVKSGRLHTLLTCAFSHAEFDHLLTNMIGLYFFGTSIGRLFGPEFLLKLYLGGALGGSLFFLLHKALIAPSSKGSFGLDYSRIPALGASAAVNAIILLDVFLFPKNIYYVNLIIPVPAMLMGALIIGTDLWRVKKGEGEISGSAHLGGALVAALVFARLKHWI